MRHRYRPFPELAREREREYMRTREYCPGCSRKVSRRALCWVIQGRAGSHCGRCAKAAGSMLF